MGPKHEGAAQTWTPALRVQFLQKWLRRFFAAEQEMGGGFQWLTDED